MFHELLVSLYGIPGTIFKMNESGGFEVKNNLPFMHPSETELLNKICKLGSYYRKFQRFIEKYGVDMTSVHGVLRKEVGDVRQLHGQYVHAFCAGLASALRPYQAALVEIEKKVMSEPYTPLSYVYQGLEDYFFIFPTLENLINTMESKKYHGCRILDLLHEAANCGIPAVKDTVDKILHTTHCVLFKQLSAWMLYGLLLDEYQEFFIRDVKKGKPGGANDVDETDGGGLSSSTILVGVSRHNILEELQLEDEQLLKNQENAGISIEHSMLPSYIPNRVAEKIQFIGQSVRMLKDTGSLKIQHYITKFGDILQGREREFLQTLHRLQQQPHVSIPSLENEIDAIKCCVAEQLWKLVVVDSDLIKHLKLLKEMYLLGRGELYLTFIDHAYNMMKGPASNNVAYDINATFKQSLAKILTWSEEYEQLFEMKMDMGTTGKDEDKDPNLVKTNWDYLKIEYRPPWPLHLLFTPPVMEKYSSLFTFLLRVRRAQIELQNVWALQMSANRSRDVRDQGSGATWGLRRQMAFFVDNLQYYLQVDVLETQFAFLLDKIKKTHNFQAIHTALDHFLIEMLKQSFISMTKVFGILNKSLQICANFCELVKVSKDHWEEKEKTKTLEYSKDFEKQTSLLFKILSNVRIHQTSPHLAQLLLRIDFNKYFTKNSVFDLD